MSDQYVTLTWMDDRTETHYGHTRIIDSGGGLLQIIESRSYGPDEVKLSVPMVNLRSWTASDEHPGPRRVQAIAVEPKAISRRRSAPR